LVLIVLADQLGRSVGDMYAGAIVPGLLLTALYCGYIMLVTIFRPKLAPALPPEARTLGSGTTSLLVMIAIGIGVGLACHFLLLGVMERGADIWAATVAVVVVYVVALANRTFKLNLLSRLAQQVI